MKLVKYLFIICVLLLFASVSTHAQRTTISDGNWNNPAIWSSGSIPTSIGGAIIVNHNVTIPSGYSVSIDETTINGTLTINAGGQVTLADGTGVDLTMAAGSSLTVNGDFVRNNLSTINQDVASTASFGAASNYHHKYQTTEGAPPLATWNATSNFYLDGFTNTSILDITSSSWNQNFGNFIYNCTGQKSIVSFNGLITSIQGNLSFLSTGTNIVRLTDNEVNVTITVAGDFTISGTSRVNFSEDGTGGILNLSGNFTFTSTSALGSYLTNTGSFAANITGNFIENANTGRIYMAGSLGSTGTSTFNLYKNFTLTSGFISEAGTGTANGNIRFVGNGSFNLINTGSVLNWINWYVAPTVTLDLGTSPISAGTGSTFTLDAGATLICGSLEPTGAIRTTTTLGNVRTPNVGRNYVTGSTVIYRSSSPQFMGDGQPSGSGVTTIIDNSNGVTLYQGTATTLTINGTLRLQTGMLFIGARTLSLTGTVTYGTGTFGGSSSSVLLIGGTSGGSFGTLTFDPSNNLLGTLTLNRTGSNGSVDINSTLTVANQLNLTFGSINNNAGLTAGNGCVVTRYPTGFLLLNHLAHGSNLYDVTYRTASTTGTSVTFSTALELPSAADVNALNNLIINTAQSADAVDLSQDVTVNGNISYNKGNFDVNSFTLTMSGSTWSDNAGTFVPGTGLVIFDGATTLTGTGTPILGNVQLNAGHTLTLGKSSNISGNIDFRSGSTFDPSIFTLSLNGSTLQTISANGADFFNLTVIKSGGSDVTLTSGLKIISALRFNNPSTNCDFQSNGFLTLVSTGDSVGTATVPLQGQIYRFASGNTVSGDVIVQRYMSGEGRIYRYLSSPVANATVASWKDDFAITGTFSNPSSGQTICGTALKPSVPSLFYYNENQAGGADVGYVNYPSSGLASSNPLIVGRGYAAFIRQCSTPTIVDVTGPVNQGTITFGITYTNTGDPSADGYNLVGNPYPCTVDWDAGWTKTRISNVIAIKDNGSGVMNYWDGTTGAIANGEIAVGQGFWIRATGANPILRIGETAKVLTPNQAAEFFRKATPNVIAISLSNGKIKDRAYIKTRPESKNTIDDWDAPKLDNDLFDLYTLSEDSIRMAINSFNNITCSSSFILGIKDMDKQSYTLAVENLSGIFEQYSLTLVDNYTNQSILFTSPYQFSVDSNPLSASPNRFVLQVGPKIPSAPIQLNYQNVLCQNIDASIKLASSVNSVSYQLVNANGQIVSTLTGNGGELSFTIPSDKLSSSANAFVVKSISSCNTTYDSKDVQITVEKTPDTFIASDSSNCGPGSVSLKARGVPSDYTVNWFSTNDSQEILFSGFVYQTPALNKTSTYYAAALSPNGCSSVRVPAIATIVNIDSPVITEVGSDVLSVDYSDGIQWAFNGSPIIGATGSSISIDKSGIYSVTVTENGCSVSAERQFTITDIPEINSAEVVLYPNPVDRYLYIRDKSVTMSNLSFVDNIGKTRSVETTRENGQIRIDMEDFSSGVYYLQIMKDGKSGCYKIIKK